MNSITRMEPAVGVAFAAFYLFSFDMNGRLPRLAMLQSGCQTFRIVWSGSR
jgi:hypothetical protein